MARIAGADDPHNPVPLDYLTKFASAFHRCSDFHNSVSTIVSKTDKSPHTAALRTGERQNNAELPRLFPRFDPNAVPEIRAFHFGTAPFPHRRSGGEFFLTSVSGRGDSGAIDPRAVELRYEPTSAVNFPYYNAFFNFFKPPENFFCVFYDKKNRPRSENRFFRKRRTTRRRADASALRPTAKSLRRGRCPRRNRSRCTRRH